MKKIKMKIIIITILLIGVQIWILVKTNKKIKQVEHLNNKQKFDNIGLNKSKGIIEMHEDFTPITKAVLVLENGDSHEFEGTYFSACFRKNMFSVWDFVHSNKYEVDAGKNWKLQIHYTGESNKIVIVKHKFIPLDNKNVLNEIC